MGNCIRHESRVTWTGDDWGSPASERLFASDKRDVGLYDKGERKSEIEEEKLLGEKGSVSSTTREVKIKITKKQLEELLERVDVQGLAVEQVLAQFMNVSHDQQHRPWRPALQSIPELSKEKGKYKIRMGNCVSHESPVTWAGDNWGSPASERLFASDKRHDRLYDKGMSTSEIEEEKLLGEKGSVSSSAKEVKIKITKKQLEELLEKADVQGVSVEQVLAQFMNVSHDQQHRSWRPALQSIPEINGV
ncbi:hypothetical protein HHK36_023860 [Tetracentron sinense]|uniref:Uncharacterized protein n=1 Tax=Tetracentron sinense TaxID=13715 RepID=A0A834YM35_TETSI|nr:hypothetical protein HHK36_023860 [Tetracentron sinense]